MPNSQNGIDQLLDSYDLDAESKCRLHDYLIGMNDALHLFSAGTPEKPTPESLNRCIDRFVNEMLCVAPASRRSDATGGS